MHKNCNGWAKNCGLRRKIVGPIAFCGSINASPSNQISDHILATAMILSFPDFNLI